MPIQDTSTTTPRLDLREAFHEYNPEGITLVANQILPARGVPRKSGEIKVIIRENLLNPDVNHANGASFERIVLRSEPLTYQCVDRGLEIQLTDSDRAEYSNDFDAEVESVQTLKTQIAIAKEVRMAAAAFDTTNFTGATLYTDNSGSPWDNVSTNIITQILAAKEKVRLNTGVMADSLLIGEAALVNMLNNTGIKNQFPGAPLITLQMIRQALVSIFGLQNLIVGGGVYNSADEGQTFSGSDIWGDDYALIFKRHTGSLAQPGLGRQLFWDELDDGSVSTGQMAANISIEQYREEQTKSDVFRAIDYSQEKIFDYNFGHLLKIDV